MLLIIFVSDSVKCGEESATNTEYTERYASFMPLAGIFAIVYSAGVPYLFHYLVRRFKNLGKAGDRVVQSSLGWMYEPFRDGKEWWLSAECVRILLLTSTVGIMARDCWMKFLVVIILSTIFLMVFLHHRPYRNSQHTLMQSMAMCVPVFSAGWALAGGWETDHLARRGDAQTDESQYDSWSIIALHVILFMPPVVLNLFTVLASAWVGFHVRRQHRMDLAPAAVGSSMSLDPDAAEAASAAAVLHEARGAAVAAPAGGGGGGGGGDDDDNSFGSSWSSWSDDDASPPSC